MFFKKFWNCCNVLNPDFIEWLLEKINDSGLLGPIKTV